MAVAIAWLPGPAGTRRRVAKPSVEEPDAAEPARPDLWGARVSNDPGLPDHPPAPFDSDDAIVPPSLEHLTIDARRPKEALTHPNVVLEPLGRDQRESPHASAEDDVVEDGRGVSRGAAAEHAPGPQSGPHLDGRTQPCGSALVADERARRTCASRPRPTELGRLGAERARCPPYHRAMARAGLDSGEALQPADVARLRNH